MSITIHDIDIAALNYDFSDKVFMVHDLAATQDETVHVELERLFNPDFIFSHENNLSNHRNILLGDKSLSYKDNSGTVIARFNGEVTGTPVLLGKQSGNRLAQKNNGDLSVLMQVSGDSIFNISTDGKIQVGTNISNQKIDTIGNNLLTEFDGAPYFFIDPYKFLGNGKKYGIGDVNNVGTDSNLLFGIGSDNFIFESNNSGNRAFLDLNNFNQNEFYFQLSANNGVLPALNLFNGSPSNTVQPYSWGYFEASFGDGYFIPLYK